MKGAIRIPIDLNRNHPFKVVYMENENIQNSWDYETVDLAIGEISKKYNSLMDNDEISEVVFEPNNHFLSYIFKGRNCEWKIE